MTKRDVLKTVDEISLTALANDNRNFINNSVNGTISRAISYPGATLSLAGPGRAHRFADQLFETSMRVRTATGNVTPALGSLPI